MIKPQPPKPQLTPRLGNELAFLLDQVANSFVALFNHEQRLIIKQLQTLSQQVSKILKESEIACAKKKCLAKKTYPHNRIHLILSMLRYHYQKNTRNMHVMLVNKYGIIQIVKNTKNQALSFVINNSCISSTNNMNYNFALI